MAAPSTPQTMPRPQCKAHLDAGAAAELGRPRLVKQLAQALEALAEARVRACDAERRAARQAQAEATLQAEVWCMQQSLAGITTAQASADAARSVALQNELSALQVALREAEAERERWRMEAARLQGVVSERDSHVQALQAVVEQLQRRSVALHSELSALARGMQRNLDDVLLAPAAGPVTVTSAAGPGSARTPASVVAAACELPLAV